MAFYKIQYSKLNKKYYPAAKIVGQVSMKKLAKKLSDRSTVTLSDCYAVLAEIGDVMSDFLASGYSVELTGLGSFRYTIDSSKNGKDTPEEVSAADINGERIRFIPEMTRNSDRTVAIVPVSPKMCNGPSGGPRIRKLTLMMMMHHRVVPAVQTTMGIIRCKQTLPNPPCEGGDWECIEPQRFDVD